MVKFRKTTEFQVNTKSVFFMVCLIFYMRQRMANMANIRVNLNQYQDVHLKYNSISHEPPSERCVEILHKWLVLKKQGVMEKGSKQLRRNCNYKIKWYYISNHTSFCLLFFWCFYIFDIIFGFAWNSRRKNNIWNE